MTPYQLREQERKAKEGELLVKLKGAGPELAVLLAKMSEEWTYEDLIYRFYHGSFKVYWLQAATKHIVGELALLHPDVRAIAPPPNPHHREDIFPGTPSGIADYPLDKWFMEIMRAGTGIGFQHEHNDRWTEVTRPIVEAFFHARFFLEMAVKYQDMLDAPPGRFPSGWAAFLGLYNLR